LINNLSKKAQFLKINEESILESNIAWIFGANRSGTSWLLRQLLASDKINGIDEPLIGQHLGIVLERPEEVLKQIEIYGNRKGYFFSNHYKETWNYYLRKLILNRVNSQFHDLSKKIVIKEPNGSMGADIIAKCLPNCKLIMLIRDGRDVVDSRLDALSSGGWSTKRGWKTISKKDRVPFLEHESTKWVAIINNLKKTYENHPEHLKFWIRYEDLLANTLTRMKEIFNFLEISITDKEIQNIVECLNYKNVPMELKGKGKRKRAASPGKWKVNLTEEEISLMEKIMGNTLRKLGYK